MSSFRVIAIPQSIADDVRATRTSPFSAHPTHVEVAQGYGPCRLCLHTFAVGAERRILLTYDSFAGTETLPLPGPVWIHEAACERHAEQAGFPEDLRRHALTFNAYARGRRLVAVEYVEDGDVDTVLDRLLTRADVDYIHVRDTEAGCYDCRIERVQPKG
jgi:hypothetical protein